MSPVPWRPPGLEDLAALGVRLDTEEGALQEERVVWSPSHRIIASEYAGENLFDRLTSDVDYLKLQDEVESLRDIADLTNAHVQHEAGHIDLVRAEDRIYGRGTGLIMAAFAFPGRPSRFSDGTAGVYYASSDLETAIAETRHHEQEILWGSAACVVEKMVIQAQLDGTLVDLRNGCPSPTGVYDANDYAAAQAFGRIVRHLDGYGIVYDSVRRKRGECAAIFRPPVLSNAIAVQTLEYHWDGAQIVAVR